MKTITLPLINVKTDPLDALLYGLGLRLAYLAKQTDNASFAKLLKDKEVAILFTSGDVARYYRFVDGCFGQASGRIDNANLTIDFKDSLMGAKLLTKGDTASLMSAIQDGDVKVSGDYKLVLWFAGVAKQATAIPDAYKPYVEKAKPYLEKTKPYLARAERLIKSKKR